MEDFDAGLKTFGSVGRHRFGVLDAYRRSGEDHLAWRYQHMLGTNGAASLSGLTRRLSGEPDNDVYDVSAYWNDRFDGGNHHYSFASTHSRTEGEGGDDSYLSLFTSHTRFQGLSWNCSYESTLPEFRSDDGYVPETGVREFRVGFDHRRDFDEGDIQQRRAYLFLYNGSSDDGRRRRLWTEYNWRFRNGRWWQVGLTQGERDGFDLTDAYLWAGWNEKDIYRSGAAGLNVGERYGEPYWYSGLGQAFRPTDRWSAQLDIGVLHAADLDEDGNVVPPDTSSQLVLTATHDITEERSVSARLVHSSGDTNFYTAYRQRVRKGMDLLIVVGDPNADEWVSRLAVKAIWCL